MKSAQVDQKSVLPAILQDFLRIDADRLKVNGITSVSAHPRGASPYGVIDMAGNILEITATAWSPYPYSPRDGRER